MLPKGPYNPQDHESKIYQLWEESAYFKPDNLPFDKKAPAFSIAMPPVNVTGVLHLGHALENALMDIEIRYQRMKGKRAIIIPGTDHAAVATQAKVEKELIKSGRYKNPRQELGREKLLEIIKKYAEESQTTILKQIKKLGTSCDWSHLAYTFDEQREKAVNQMFLKMYQDDLIYRAYRVVNWSVKGQSTCSDDELEYKEQTGKLYYFKYTADFPIPIATTRPETKLGDTAVAVNPQDKRYKKYIGKTFEVDLGAKNPLQIKVIADKIVDPSYGTGAVGVTPAHSQIDFELKEKYDLELIPVIDQSGRMTENAGKNYAGLKVLQARKKFIAWLKEKNLFIKEEDIQQNIGTSDRFGDVVEVLPMLQWFVVVNKKIPGRNKSLKDLMREAVTSGHNNDPKQKIEITPARFKKNYLHWIDNLRDWCISRQIWFGHRIPAWHSAHVTYFKKKILYKKLDIKNDAEFDIFSDKFYVNDNEKIQWATPGEEAHLSLGYVNLLKSRGYLNESWINNNEIKKPTRKSEIIVGENAPEKIGWEQDPDTLDTWFSSGLWTFSTLGWPDKTKDLKRFHPTTWMQMGYEILFFWMARMILMSTYALDEIPFYKVYIHGMLRDKQGKKFSKSRGVGIDPRDVCDKYGTDALRMSLIFGTTPGNDSRFYEDKVIGFRRFANKIWNASKFVLNNLGEDFDKICRDAPWRVSTGNPHDKDILDKLDKAVKKVTKDLDNFMFHEAAQEIYQFFWHEFCDIYLETTKPRLSGKDEKDKQVTQFVLYKVLLTSLKLLHPFMPFITEVIYQELPLKEKKALIIEDWPE